jgi:hypothetical protein
VLHFSLFGIMEGDFAHFGTLEVGRPGKNNVSIKSTISVGRMHE